MTHSPETSGAAGNKRGESTVVLLGAGASHASKYALPVMRGFFDEHRPTAKSALGKFIRQHCYGSRTPSSNWDLEDIMTHLQVLGDSLFDADPHSGSFVADVRAELETYLLRRLVVIPLGAVATIDYVPSFYCEQHESLFGSIGERYSVLSLNYDLVADGTLYRMAKKQQDHVTMEHDALLDRSYQLLGPVRLWHGERPALPMQDREKGYYIKLHGSIDWYCCPNPNCQYHSMLFQNWPSSKDVHVSTEDLCFLCGRRLIRAMIAPSMGKTLEELPKLRVLWNLAYTKLSEARRWIVVGVSLAKSDYYLTTMLREARNRTGRLELVVINPAPAHRKQLKRLLRPTEFEEADNLQEWLDRQTA